MMIHIMNTSARKGRLFQFGSKTKGKLAWLRLHTYLAPRALKTLLDISLRMKICASTAEYKEHSWTSDASLLLLLLNKTPLFWPFLNAQNRNRWVFIYCLYYYVDFIFRTALYGIYYVFYTQSVKRRPQFKVRV